MRLIDADDFRNWIFRQKRLSKYYTIMILDEMKTIDPESLRPKARWLKISVPFNTGNECSNCGWGYSESKGFPDFKFCPNCGAKMDLGEGEANGRKAM